MAGMGMWGRTCFQAMKGLCSAVLKCTKIHTF